MTYSFQIIPKISKLFDKITKKIPKKIPKTPYNPKPIKRLFYVQTMLVIIFYRGATTALSSWMEYEAKVQSGVRTLEVM